jgi:hypothetical protein
MNLPFVEAGARCFDRKYTCPMNVFIAVLTSFSTGREGSMFLINFPAPPQGNALLVMVNEPACLHLQSIYMNMLIYSSANKLPVFALC